jgi:hypothetical protein
MNDEDYNNDDDGWKYRRIISVILIIKNYIFIIEFES